MQQPALWLVALNALLHEVGLPLPLTPTVLVAGAASVSGGAHPVALIGVLVVAMLAGNAVWFAAGRRYGSRVLKLLCRLSLSSDTCVRRTEDAFGRWGWSSLILGRFIPGVSLVAPPLAGALGMSWSKFVVLSAASAAIWATAFVGAGMLLHAQVDALMREFVAFGFEALASIALLLAAYVAWRWLKRRRAARRLDLPRITVAELKALMDRGAAPVVVDVRGANMRQVDPRRIPTSIAIDINAVPDLPRDREIVLYCNCPNEASAAHVAQLLLERGYRRARPLLGGLDGWIEAGYGVDTPPSSRAAERRGISAFEA
jgi:membrane protein DedA with SNARE-associated domain/rhodanese-related sulfurtransferase